MSEIAKPWPKVRVIKAFGNHSVGRILNDNGRHEIGGKLYRDTLIARGYIEMVAEPVLAATVTPEPSEPQAEAEAAPVPYTVGGKRRRA